MKRFKHILVGIDLSAGDRLVGEALATPSEYAVKQALWLAALNGARVTFLYSLDVCPRAQRMLLEAQDEHTVVDDARESLSTLVGEAEKLGVTASYKLAMGHGWIEVIGQVLKFNHDLVVVGTRNGPAVSRILFGSTGMKLLRKCPCPVWITKPSESECIDSVLVAHDLSPVGALALQLGASISELQHSALHVLHIVECMKYADVRALDNGSATLSVRKSIAHSQISAELQAFKFTATPRITIEEGDPAELILKYIDDHRIELLTMGTIARSGIGGVITGNTAERLLPRIPCSVLAVKPSDFVSPIKASS